MAIGDWHPGKLAIIWGIGFLLVWASSKSSGGYDVFFILAGTTVGVAAVIVTWRWLSAKEVRK